MKCFLVQWRDNDDNRQETEVKLDNGDRFDAMDVIFNLHGKVMILRAFEVELNEKEIQNH